MFLSTRAIYGLSGKLSKVIHFKKWLGIVGNVPPRAVVILGATSRFMDVQRVVPYQTRVISPWIGLVLPLVATIDFCYL